MGGGQNGILCIFGTHVTVLNSNRHDIFTAVKIQLLVSWIMTPCSPREEHGSTFFRHGGYKLLRLRGGTHQKTKH